MQRKAVSLRESRRKRLACAASKPRPQAKAARKLTLPGGFAPFRCQCAVVFQGFAFGHRRCFALACEPIGRLIEFKAMSTAKNRLALIASVFAILGLLYSPVCALRCASSDCLQQPATEMARQPEPIRHCHHHGSETSSPTSQAHHSAPPQPSAPGNCPSHADAVAVLSAKTKAPSALQSLTAPLVAALPHTTGSDYSGLAAKLAADRLFRSPPSRAVLAVYRI